MTGGSSGRLKIWAGVSMRRRLARHCPSTALHSSLDALVTRCVLGCTSTETEWLRAHTCLYSLLSCVVWMTPSYHGRSNKSLLQAHWPNRRPTYHWQLPSRSQQLQFPKAHRQHEYCQRLPTFCSQISSPQSRLYKGWRPFFQDHCGHYRHAWILDL